MTSSKRALQRRAPRLPIERQGRLSGRASHVVTVLDLSATGCLVRCDSLLDTGAILDLQMDLEAGPSEPFAAKVRVADASLDGSGAEGGHVLAGLEFLGLPAREDTRLRRFLEQERRRRRADAPAR
jgi:hypothetical protein